jgi:hypothetical protein
MEVSCERGQKNAPSKGRGAVTKKAGSRRGKPAQNDENHSRIRAICKV